MTIGGYRLDLYCSNSKAEHHRGGWYNFGLHDDRRFPIEYSDDGPRSYYTTRSMAKRDGWTLKRNGDAICPLCNKIKTT